MSKRRNDQEVLSAFEGFDEGVRLLMEETERRAEESRLSPQERKKLAEMRRREEEKKRKAKEKAEAQKANRVFTYLPAELKETIEKIAAKESVSMAQVITFFLLKRWSNIRRTKSVFGATNTLPNRPVTTGFWCIRTMSKGWKN